MNGVFLLLGSNLGDANEHLDIAKTAIARIGRVINKSSVYKTKAWGKNDQPDFLNQVLEISYRGTPQQLLNQVLNIEKEMGRVRETKWGPRVIDIDILFFGNEVIDEPALKIPHPEIQNRKFTLVPLNQIAPDVIHPRLNKTINDLLRACTDILDVKLA